MMDIWLVDFPIPPSINAQHASVGGRMIKSKEARMFDAQVSLYIHKHKKRLQQINEYLKPQVDKGNALRVDCIVAFHVERLLTKGSNPQSWCKTLDANNRNKAILDGLVRCIDIDDKFYFAGNCEKVTCDRVYDEQVLIKISVMEPRRLHDIVYEIAEINKGSVQ